MVAKSYILGPNLPNILSKSEGECKSRHFLAAFICLQPFPTFFWEVWISSYMEQKLSSVFGYFPVQKHESLTRKSAYEFVYDMEQLL